MPVCEASGIEHCAADMLVAVLSDELRHGTVLIGQPLQFRLRVAQFALALSPVLLSDPDHRFEAGLPHAPFCRLNA